MRQCHRNVRRNDKSFADFSYGVKSSIFKEETETISLYKKAYKVLIGIRAASFSLNMYFVSKSKDNAVLLKMPYPDKTKFSISELYRRHT